MSLSSNMMMFGIICSNACEAQNYAIFSIYPNHVSMVKNLLKALYECFLSLNKFYICNTKS